MPHGTIKVRVFAERGIAREGLADTLILNPIPFDRDEELPEQVRGWLTGPDFVEDPVETTREGLFKKATSGVTQGHWHYLEVMMVLSRGTTNEVARSHVLTMLNEMGGLRDAKIEDELISKGFLLRGASDPTRGIVPIALTPGFIDLIADELRRKGPSWSVPASRSNTSSGGCWCGRAC